MKIDEYASSFVGEPYSWGSWSVCEWAVQQTLKELGIVSEKKTFKNPTAVMRGESSASPHYVWHVSDFYGSYAGEFDPDLYELEITFTKKPAQFKIGDKVYTRHYEVYLYTVIGLYKNTVVVVNENDDEIEYFEADELKHA